MPFTPIWLWMRKNVLAERIEEELEGLQTSVLSAIAQCFSTKGTTLFSKKYLANLSPGLNELGHKNGV